MSSITSTLTWLGSCTGLITPAPKIAPGTPPAAPPVTAPGDVFVQGTASPTPDPASSRAHEGNELFLFRGDPTLGQVAAGTLTLSAGAKGSSVSSVQKALELAGYALHRFGADGELGDESVDALKRFQQEQGIDPPSGVVDAQTLARLAPAAAKNLTYPRYDDLFRDGVLSATIAVGFDETGADKPAIKQVVDGLAGPGGQGYTHVDPATTPRLDLLLAGIDPDAMAPGVDYFVKRFEHEGKEVKSVVKLITRDTPDAKQSFANSMANDDLILYGGHGRYGVGPDFDDIKSPDGNFVIGRAVEAGHVVNGPNDLKAAPLSAGYQLMMFSGCSTRRYLDELRSIPQNKDTENLDLIVSTDTLYWKDTGNNVLATLSGVTAGQSVDEMVARLEVLNAQKGVSSLWKTDGFQDN